MIFRLCSLIVALVMALAGCATPGLAPPAQISESTWRQVDNDIRAASLDSAGQAKRYALGSMTRWKGRVNKRIETDFIPWFTNYWTQQWLAIKVAWYRLSSEEGAGQVAMRLAAHLQDEFKDRVLDPVAEKLDPDAIRGQATKFYLHALGEKLQGIPGRYGIPPDRFDQRLGAIPAIELTSPAAVSASLQEVVHALPDMDLPAYAALLGQIRTAPGGGEAGPLNSRISPVAQRASERLLAKLSTSVGTSAAAAAVGGVGGVVISLGAVGFGASAHEKERPAMEAQLRENLNAALEEMWLTLTEDPATGVLAGVHHISELVEGSLANTTTRPGHPEATP